MKKSLLLIVVSALALGACNSKPGSADQEQKAGSAVGVDLASMDKTIAPGENFFLYANGNWVKKSQIPADRSSIGAFFTARQEVEKQNLELINSLLKSNPDANSNEGRIVSYFKAYNDQAAIDSAGMAPVKADLDRFMAIQDKGQLAEVLGGQIRADVDPFNATDFNTENLFGIFVTQGLATPGEVVPYVLQGGLGLPDREYYLSGDKEMADIRSAYKPYIQQVLTLAGVPDPAARAQRIYDLEMRIAQAHVTREEANDYAKAAAIWTRADFQKNAPGLDWNRFLNAAQLSGYDKFDAYEANAIRNLSALVASQPLDAWKDWLVFHQINSHADVLPSKIDQANFAFFGGKLNGQPQQLPREKRALTALNANLGDAMGKAYVDKYFPASAKTEVQQMVANIKAAFAAKVKALDWMAPSTKAEALKKVENIEVGVGYPDTWRDYGSLQLGTSAYANQVAAQKAEYAHQLGKIGKAPDRKEWWMTPQTVNAVNLPVQNALNFPAGLLQRPFFDAKADPAFNYGAVGSVIGHEISHSFDNNGAAFDATGALRDWWTPADLKRFQEAGAALAKQFDAYEALPGLHVRGELTLGENIADVAGLSAAYDAYHASLNGKPAPVIDGLTGDQRFFIAYGQAHASKMRDGYLRQIVTTNEHAPDPFRALTVRNLDAWYQAFGVKPGAKLYLAPEQRVKVWG
ncbi:MAG TPA: M13 family metallopeptidase [Sphingomicrobium sp.]|nr:M13 family metallopeptidase [Sphingomicrobium sp.]